MVWAGFIICMIFVAVFLLIMRFERRTLWSGFSFMIMAGCLACYTLFLLLSHLDLIKSYPILFKSIVAVGAMSILFFIMIPAIVLVMYFVEGIKVIRKEGLRASNLLSLLFICCLL